MKNKMQFTIKILRTFNMKNKMQFTIIIVRA